MTIAELVAFAMATRTSHSPTRVELAERVIEMFGSLPDWPCGWERADTKTTTEYGLEVTFAGGSECTPEEAIAIGLDLFEKGRERSTK